MKELEGKLEANGIPHYELLLYKGKEYEKRTKKRRDSLKDREL